MGVVLTLLNGKRVVCTLIPCGEALTLVKHCLTDAGSFHVNASVMWRVRSKVETHRILLFLTDGYCL